MRMQLVFAAVMISATTGLAKDLVWNGGAGGTWNDTASVWLDGATPCAWEDGATAVFSGGGIVAVSGEIKAGGIRFTSTGTALAGDGLILLNGAVDAAAGTTNSISTRLYANPAMSKTGGGTVALSYTRGAFAINEGTVYAGGFNMLNTSVTVDPAATLKWVSGGAKASTLLKNGSFESPAYNGYRYISVNTLSSWTRGTANYVIQANAAAQKSTWGNALSTVPDGSMILAIQMNGEISQTFNVPADGFYDLSFYMYKRGNYTTHQLYLYMDGLFWLPLYDSLHSSQMTNNKVDTGAIWLSAGSHTLKIAGEGYWGDTTTFIDDLVFAQPTLEDTASIPSSSGTVVDVASGEQTFSDAYTLTADAHGFRRFSKTGSGKAVFTQNLAIGGETIYDVEGEAEYSGTITGAVATVFHKRGTGALTLTTPGTVAFRLENGNLRVKNFTSSMTVAYRVDQGVTAGFYPGLASGDATISAQMDFSGNGTCALGTLGDGRTLTVSAGAELNTASVVFDVGAGDTLKFGNLRAKLVGNNYDYVDTAIVKTGPGAMELTAAPTRYAPTGFTVREGTLVMDFADKPYYFSYTPVNKATVSTNTYGILRTADIPLVLGDRNSSASSAVTFRMNSAGFTSPRPIIVNAQPSSASLEVAAGKRATLLGATTVNRSLLNLSGSTGSALSLGDVVVGVDETTLALDANLSLALDGEVNGTVSLSAPSAAGFNLKSGMSGTTTFKNVELGGIATVDFDGNGCDSLSVTGTLTLHATEFTLLDSGSGSDFARGGRYVLARYGAFDGDVADLSVANEVEGYHYSFSASGGELVLTISADESVPTYTWAGASSGSFADAGNWDHETAPNGQDKTVVFTGGAGAVNATLSGSATVGEIIGENASGVTLSGGNIVFSSSGTPIVHAKYGTLVVSSAISGVDAVTVMADPGAYVVIDGSVTCDLLLDGEGVSVGANAVVTGNVTVKSAGGLKMSAGSTVTEFGTNGLMGSYWRLKASATTAQRSTVTNWVAFKAFAQTGTLVAEQLMDCALGFSMDDSSNMNLPEELQGNASTANNWMGYWEGYVTIPVSGRYGFRLECDDDGLLAIDGQNVTQCLGMRANSCSVPLAAGVHRIFAGMYDESGNAKLRIHMQTPEGVVQILPLSWLTPDIPVGYLSGTGTIDPESVLTVAPTNGLSSWFGTLNGDGALGKTGEGVFETKLTKGSLMAAEGLLAANSAGVADSVAVVSGAKASMTAGGTAKGLSGGGTFAAGAYAYGLKISCDADCGISSNKTYTHKVNVCSDSYTTGISPVATVNGVRFDNINAASGSGKFSSNIWGGLTGQAQSSYTDPQTGDTGLVLLLRTMNYAGKTNHVTMTGLVPGKVYDFRAYYRPYGSSDRKFRHVFETGGKEVASIVWDSNKDGGVTNSDPSITRGYSVVGCRYVAGADGKIVLHTYKVNVKDPNGYHFYAYTNEEVADSAAGVTLVPGAESAFDGTIEGERAITVSGSGRQTFRGGIAAPLAVTGTVVLDGGAAATGGVSVAQGGLLEMRPGSTAGALTGAGSVFLAHGEHGLRGALQADGTFAEPAFPRRIFFSGDDDCGISSGKRYAHAWNCGSNTVWTTVVNGAQLAQFYRNTTPKDDRRFVSMECPGGGEQSGSMRSSMSTGFAGTEIIRVLSGMCYGGLNSVFKFTGLKVGKDYELRFYNRAWSTFERQCIFKLDQYGTVPATFDYNENDSDMPCYIAFRICPTNTTFTMQAVSQQTANAPHFYGITIEEALDYTRAVDSDVDGVFSGAVTGRGAFAKRGAGVQTFSGAVSATGPWTVEEGGLMLANNQASVSNVAVLAGATFGGFGRVEGDLGIAAGGHLALSAAGTLVVGGNMVVADESALDVAFNADGTGSGGLSVAGTLTLPDDLTIMLSGADRPQTRQRLLSATGGITCDPSNWTVTDASGKPVTKAGIKLLGNSLTLILDKGSIILFK